MDRLARTESPRTRPSGFRRAARFLFAADDAAPSNRIAPFPASPQSESFPPPASRPDPIFETDAHTDDPTAERIGVEASGVHWIVPLGVVVGLIWIAVFRVAWRIFGEPEFATARMLPALAVVLAECLITGRAVVLAPARLRAGAAEARCVPAVGLILVLTVITMWALIMNMPARVGWYPPPDDPRAWFHFLYPQVTYRPLLLAPIWGRWAILLAGGVGRAAGGADPSTRRMLAACAPMKTLVWAAVPFVLTAMYTVREGALFGGLLSALLVMVSTFAAAHAAARLEGGQSRTSVMACACLAQLVFLVSYRAMCV